ncbi:uncharacterized protein [Amphiura filiformis]|uniref:uncharacterized protein n=1 Tax=Amphiura filiformis TaxID=82378 RepID=UPI003B215C05
MMFFRLVIVTLLVQSTLQQECLNTSPFFLGSQESSSTIQKICPDFQNSKELALGVTAIGPVGFDPVDDLVYFGDGTSSIHRGLSDDRYTNDDPCFSEVALSNAQYFDIDHVNRKLYWAYGFSGEVGVADLDGANREVLYGPGPLANSGCGAPNVGGRNVVDIRVDVPNGMLYWGSSTSAGRLSKGPISGDAPCEDLRTNIHIFCMEINPEGTKIYWVNTASLGSPPLLILCANTADDSFCDGRPSDIYNTLTGITGGFVTFDMKLYDGCFYITIHTSSIVYKIFRVDEIPDASPTEITGIAPQVFLFAQPNYAVSVIRPTEVFFDTDVFTGMEGSSVQITITRTGNAFRCSTMTITTHNTGSATPTSDYIETETEVRFAPKMSTVTFGIMLPNDGVVEGDEAFSVSLSNAIEATLGSRTMASVIITDIQSSVKIATPDMTSFDESDGVVYITVIRDQNIESVINAVLSLTYSSTSVPPTTVFTETEVEFIFPSGTRSVNVWLTIIDDNFLENDEILTVTLSLLSNGCCLADPSVIEIVVRDDDESIEFSQESYTTLESETAVVTLVRIGNVDNDVTVMLSTTSSSARKGVDYEELKNTMVKIPAGENMVDTQINIIDDIILEATEYFTVRLSSDVNGDIGTLRRARIYIVDNEVELVMKETFIEVRESAGMVMIPIQRLGYEGTPVTVDIQVNNKALSDVELVSSTVNFASDETESNATLRITDDEMVEEDQRVSVSLVDAQGGMIASPRTAIIVIKDDDYYRTVDSTATSLDYISSSGTVQFDSGETLKEIDIRTVYNPVAEWSDSFRNSVLILDDDTSVVPRPQPISGAIALKTSELVIVEIDGVPVVCSVDLLDKMSPTYIMLERRIERLLTNVFKSTYGFLYVDVYDLYCGSIGVKFIVALNQDYASSETELQTTFQNVLDSEGYIDDSTLKVVPGTTLQFTDVCDTVTCNNGGSCVADLTRNTGICLCSNGFLGEMCNTIPIVETPSAEADGGLRLAEILGISIGIIFGISMLTFIMCFCCIAIRRSTMATKPLPPVTHTQQLPPLRIATQHSLLPGDITPYSSNVVYQNPVYQPDELGVQSYYWGPNRRNMYF